ncbi:uncharacterized protein LOC133528096 [Cydia pomonella]|uniref:uncharacterized protein LOC133528096 n=1 Tax=Cydia pomonella TaxID=82600 RepID=UPI002ADE27B7|nr:uncharacterized protein LOC133528096 [Cydia pomonella]
MLEKDNLRIRSYCVCCAHFDDSQVKMLKTLKRGAIPTLLLANHIQEGSTAPTERSSSTQTISSEDKDAEMVSLQNTACTVSNIDIVETKTLSAEDTLKNSSENTTSAVSNVIIIKSETQSTEEALEKSTQTPKGLKKRKHTDEPKKKCKGQNEMKINRT